MTETREVKVSDKYAAEIKAAAIAGLGSLGNSEDVTVSIGAMDLVHPASLVITLGGESAIELILHPHATPGEVRDAAGYGSALLSHLGGVANIQIVEIAAGNYTSRILD